MKPAFIFTDNMVLQRNKPIKIFGEGDGEVTVTLGGTGVSVIPQNGKWCAVLPEMEAGGPYTLEIGDQNEKFSFKNVYVGEVFIAAGQSNMEHPLFGTTGGFEFARKNQNPLIRLFTVPRRTAPGALEYTWHFETVYSGDTEWSQADEDISLHFSAVGFYFASLLQKKLGIAVGIISCNQGASRIETWIDEKMLEGTDICEKLLKSAKDSVYNADPEGYAKMYKEYSEALNEACLKADAFSLAKTSLFGVANNEALVGKPSPIAFGPRHINWPGVLYHNMVERFAPFAVKAVLWYQGESNCENAEHYFDAFKTLTECWRGAFRDNLPFLTVRISEWGGAWRGWDTVQKNQDRAAKEIEGVYIVQSADIGEVNNIHPVNKYPIGERLYEKYLEISNGEN